MNGASVKKVILMFFSGNDPICHSQKFQPSQTPHSHFLPISPRFLTNIRCRYFSLNIWVVYDQLELDWCIFDQNWAKTRPLHFQIFQILNATDRRIVQCLDKDVPLFIQLNWNGWFSLEVEHCVWSLLNDWWRISNAGGWLLVGCCTWEDRGWSPTDREAGFQSIKRCLQRKKSSAQQDGLPLLTFLQGKSAQAGGPKQIILFCENGFSNTDTMHIQHAPKR